MGKPLMKLQIKRSQSQNGSQIQVFVDSRQKKSDRGS